MSAFNSSDLPLVSLHYDKTPRSSSGSDSLLSCFNCSTSGRLSCSYAASLIFSIGESNETLLMKDLGILGDYQKVVAPRPD